MGLLDSMLGAALGGNQHNANAGGDAGGALGGINPQVLMGLIGLLLSNSGGLSGLLSKLQSAGLGDAAQSWVGTGSNLPVSGQDLGSALGGDLMSQIAAQLGTNSDQAAGTLANVLPGLIDQLTPKGSIPADNGMDAIGAMLGGRGGQGGAGDLMGMLGGLLKG